MMTNRFLTALHEKFVLGKPLALRSPRWHEVEKVHLEKHGVCAACNRTDKLQVHHIKPFHIYPELELEPTNLITLCEESDTKCHLYIGHLGNFKRENLNVVVDAQRAPKLA